MKQINEQHLYKYSITWWQDCPPGSGSMPNFSNSPKLHPIKKTKMYVKPLGNYKASHAGI